MLARDLQLAPGSQDLLILASACQGPPACPPWARGFDSYLVVLLARDLKLKLAPKPCWDLLASAGLCWPGTTSNFLLGLFVNIILIAAKFVLLEKMQQGAVMHW